MRDLAHWPTCPRCEDGLTYHTISRGSKGVDVDWFRQLSSERHMQCEGNCVCERRGHRPRTVALYSDRMLR